MIFSASEGRRKVPQKRKRTGNRGKVFKEVPNRSPRFAHHYLPTPFFLFSTTNKTEQKPSAPAAPKLVAALAAAAVAAFSPVAPAFAGDLVLGAKVFSNTCATCHSGGQNILEADKTLEKEALEQYLAGGFSEASIVKQVGFDFNFVDFDFDVDFVGEGDDEGEGGAGARGRELPAAAPLPLPSSSSSSPSRAAAERLTYYPVLTARNRPRAWLPKLGLSGGFGGGGGGAAGGGAAAAASAARAKTAADVFVEEAPPALPAPSPPLPSAAVGRVLEL